jgi:hypothetical protein
MNRTALSLLALLSIPAFAEGPAPAPAPAASAGDAAAPPTNGAATTATPRGSGTKKEKPAAPTNPAPPAPAEKK